MVLGLEVEIGCGSFLNSTNSHQLSRISKVAHLTCEPFFVIVCAFLQMERATEELCSSEGGR